MTPKRRVTQLHLNDDRLETLEAIKARLAQLLGGKVTDAAAIEYALRFTRKRLDTARGGSAHTAPEGAESSE